MSSEQDGQNSGENTCVVCFKNVEIFSVGCCDHPVCYECSTRMRVLCKQNECPICRQDMPKVIFTRYTDPFSKLVTSVEHNNLQDRKFGLYFAAPSLQKAYHRLLEHNCCICNKSERRWPFKTFQQLKDHMRREHELFYCDLCVTNLKIFSFERRCYTRAELGQHRRKGDADNTSHRGHPLCEFCDVRYMDMDELFRHLRRDHLFCHFCDADGKHHYYNSYDDLRNHFLEEHYLCEEGECKNEKFTSVFRTDIDLKAHMAHVHNKHLRGQANKQARTLDIEFTVAPRNTRPGGRKPHSSRDQNEGAVGFDNYFMEPGGPGPKSDTSRTNQTFVNPLRSEDFPTLGNSEAAQTPVPTSSLTFTSKITPNVFRGEDFPSLGGSSGPPRPPAVTITGKVNAYRKDFPALGGSAPSRGPEVTISKTSGGKATKSLARNNQNFPSLGESSGGSSTVRLSLNAASSNQEHRKGPNVSIHVKMAPSSGEDFPALSKGPVPQAQWVTIQKTKKPVEPKQSKVAPAPVLPKNEDFPSLSRSKGSKKEKGGKKSNVEMEIDNSWVNLNSFNDSSRNTDSSRNNDSSRSIDSSRNNDNSRSNENSRGNDSSKSNYKSNENGNRREEDESKRNDKNNKNQVKNGARNNLVNSGSSSSLQSKEKSPENQLSESGDSKSKNKKKKGKQTTDSNVNNVKDSGDGANSNKNKKNSEMGSDNKSKKSEADVMNKQNGKRTDLNKGSDVHKAIDTNKNIDSNKNINSYKTDSYKTDSYKTDSYKTDSYKTDSYKTDSYKSDSNKTSESDSNKAIQSRLGFSSSTESFGNSSKAENKENAENKANQYKNGLIKKRSELKIDSLHIDDTNILQTDDFPTLGGVKPPPGFAVKPPPGFNAYNTKKANSYNIVLANPTTPNDLTFTNSSGQSFPIYPSSSQTYYSPTNAAYRNKALIETFSSVVNNMEVMSEFRNFSDLFRNGLYPPENYYSLCQQIMGEHFDKLFPELLVLLPNVQKQQELYKVHTANGFKKGLDVCATCKQVILTRELRSHLQNHTLENHFPVLGEKTEVNNVWKK